MPNGAKGVTMTANKSLKRIIRNRMQMTDMSYSAARAQVLRGRDEIVAAGLSQSTPLFSLPQVTMPNVFPDDIEVKPGALDVVILKLNQQSARVRVLSTGEQITLRSSEVCEYVPGQIVTTNITKRWVHRGNAYASGEVGNGRIDIPALGLPLLRLEDRGVEHWRDDDEGNEEVPLAIRALWCQIGVKPRAYFEMEQILPGTDDESFDGPEDPIIAASELHDAGETAEAEEILMDVLLQDLRCLDAHAHLGNFAFHGCPETALLHYEVGVRIGMQTLGLQFTGMLPWGWLDNRPFLRCLHGYGLTLWRLGQFKEAEHIFERMIWLNPNDNQGARFNWLDVKAGKTWASTRDTN